MIDTHVSGLNEVGRDETYFQLLRFATLTSSMPSNTQNISNVLNKVVSYAPIIHRLLPRIYQHTLDTNLFGKLTKTTQEFLKQKTTAACASQIAHKTQLRQIIDLLIDKNIPVILLKGSAYNKYYYPSSYPRPCNDLDLLVKKTDFDEVVNIFERHLAYTPKPDPDVFGDLYELSFLPKGAVGYAVDLHKSLCHPYLFDVDYIELWQSSVKHPYFDHELIRMLSPEYALIHQGIHAFTDMDFNNYNLCDTYCILNDERFDDAAFIQLVKKCSAEHPSYLLLDSLFRLLPEHKNALLLMSIKPSSLSLKLSNYLLNSHHAKPKKNKSIGYRMHQVFGQFVFTGQFFRPMALQALFIKLYLLQRLKGHTPIAES